MEVKSNGLWLNKHGKKICYNPWTHFEVNNPNGNVNMCVDCGTVLGNINDQSIEQIWNGKEYQEKRRMMFEQGAEKMCSPNCLRINGMKDYESLSWYQNVPPSSPLFVNACLNEEEIRQGNEILKSKPRWMRFTPSYQCNYRCYHCYQKGDRSDNVRLPEKYFADMKALAQYYQVLFIFGGEPTIFPEFSELLRLAGMNPYVLLAMVTNASNIHKFADQIEKVKWLFIAVSLDAATSEMYKELRNSTQWERVNNNILFLSGLNKESKLTLTLAMTVNRKNYREIYDFVKLSDYYGATPKISMVCNPAGISFYKKYMWLDKKKRADILAQIDRSLKDFHFTPEATGLNVLRRHVEGGNAGYYFRELKGIIKTIVPPVVKNIIKR